MKDIGKNIKKLRIQKGMTQDALANALYVTRQTVSNYDAVSSVLRHLRRSVQRVLEIAIWAGHPRLFFAFFCKERPMRRFILRNSAYMFVGATISRPPVATSQDVFRAADCRSYDVDCQILRLANFHTSRHTN